MYDVYAYNCYGYNEGQTATMGFRDYIKGLNELNGLDKPFIITEFGHSVSPKGGFGSFGSRTLKEQSEGLVSNYRDLMDAGAVGMCPFYYADGLTVLVEGAQADTNAFVQEVVTGIDKRNIGMEIGLSAQVTSTIKLKGALALGDYVYSDNANVYATSSAINEFTDDNGNIVNKGDRIDFGTTNIKNYHVAGGPQRAASVGFEYRDPDYWWFGATANFFSNAYVDIAPITRTESFGLDADGIPFNDYDPAVARDLLAQEKFDNYMLVNIVGGKSWRIDDYYIGFFANVSNILDTKYKTGGFEQSRNANYRVLKEDQERDTPVFGSKYWYGYGASYYLNVYFRF